VARPLHCEVGWGEDVPPGLRAPAPTAPGEAPHAPDVRPASRAPPRTDPSAARGHILLPATRRAGHPTVAVSRRAMY